MGLPSALTKSVGLRTDGRVDDRSFWINYVSSLSTPLAIPLVYPRMISVHDLDAKVWWGYFSLTYLSEGLNMQLVKVLIILAFQSIRTMKDRSFLLQSHCQVNTLAMREFIFLRMVKMLYYMLANQWTPIFCRNFLLFLQLLKFLTR